VGTYDRHPVKAILMLRLEGQSLPPESVGQYVPLLFGLLYDVPAIPIHVEATV
jgi:hypothetical protein